VAEVVRREFDVSYNATSGRVLHLLGFSPQKRNGGHASAMNRRSSGWRKHGLAADQKKAGDGKLSSSFSTKPASAAALNRRTLGADRLAAPAYSSQRHDRGA